MELLVILIFLLIILLIVFLFLGSKNSCDKYRCVEKQNESSELTKKLQIKKAGVEGEKEIYYNIKHAVHQGHIFCNLRVPTGYGNTTEIDVVLIHETGIYVFESKNYSGSIYGNEYQEQWKQIKSNYEKKMFYNPIKQNDTHIRCLARYLGIDECYFYSYIVFGNRCSLNNINRETEDYLIINTCELFQCIKDDVEFNDKQITKIDVEDIYQDLLQLSYSCCE